MSGISFIVYEHGGTPYQLFGENDWREAIMRRNITRDTIVGVFRAGSGRQDMPAGHVGELRPIFDTFDPRAAPYPAPPVPGAAGGGNQTLWVALLASLSIVLVVALVITILNRPSAVPAVASPTAQSPAAAAPAANTTEVAPHIDSAATNGIAALAPVEATETSDDRPAVLQDRAMGVVTNYYASWSPSNEVAWMQSAYASEANYYGARLTPSRIMDKQIDLISRWPSRSFRLVPGSSNTSCNPATRTCTVRGLVDISYYNESQGTSMGGRAEFTIVTGATSSGMVITSESGRMLSRQ